MKKTFILFLVLSTNYLYGQEGSLNKFESKFSIVANKSEAWNTLIDLLKPTNTLRYYKISMDTIWKDPCQVIQQQGMSCPQIDYINYFKRATGTDTILRNNTLQFELNYKFETNSRPGNDIVTNIDTIRHAIFSWKIVNTNQLLSKRQLRNLFISFYNDISFIISKYYGTAIEEQNVSDNVEAKKYWTYPDNGSALARIVLLYNNKSKDFKIIFSGNIHKSS
jgi:hypothetical protein